MKESEQLIQDKISELKRLEIRNRARLKELSDEAETLRLDQHSINKRILNLTYELEYLQDKK